MITEFLFLLCLGLCLGYEDEEKNENPDASGPPPVKTDTTVIFVATFSCLSLLLLFLAVFFIYRCSQHGSSHGESTKRTSHSEFPKQEKTDLFNLERISESAGDRPEVTYAQLNTNALSETASSPAEMSPESCDYATLKE
ncbi:V-set and transmembrane domain-containing protein 1 isoform X1 [Camelus dromedarius]|uniref:V-set and transmembrane domain-containing protein 1 n=2 Tax=Camelus TaxID=9836 RepID=A0A8B7K705_CAMFR|nr:V-set and transmembrane domain-containing protein 1 [Camelus bactrianus]XP_010995133.1 V-set and transmembrane domain-containing protein 1 [Camelus dromedarius]XP_014408030.1 V-set and transmembrane domain-containing protein 1 [Camelus ferus]